MQYVMHWYFQQFWMLWDLIPEQKERIYWIFNPFFDRVWLWIKILSKLRLAHELNIAETSAWSHFVAEVIDYRIQLKNFKLQIFLKLVFHEFSGKLEKILFLWLIIGCSDSPQNALLNNRNRISLPSSVPELFNLQPTAFYFEMDSNYLYKFIIHL